MKKTIVIINEQHTILEEQKCLLNSKFTDGWEFLKVPSSGWTLEEQNQIKEDIIKYVDLFGFHGKSGNVVFVSPIPYLYGRLQIEFGYHVGNYDGNIGNYKNVSGNVYVFHNDKREKKELPNGKIISVTSKTGWQII
jgi:hypothetical protein